MIDPDRGIPESHEDGASEAPSEVPHEVSKTPQGTAESTASSPPPAPDPPSDEHGTAVAGQPAAASRRGFAIQAVTAVLSVLLVVVPLVPGLAFFLTPLLRRRQQADGSGKRDADGFVRLNIAADALPEDGTPVMVTVFDDEIDAWNKFPDQPIGTVWLRKTEDGRVLALSTICPHLGCMVDFRSGQRDFFCPCHTSAFDLNGERLNQIPPRNMDALEVKVADGVVWVRYQTFRAGTPEKIPV